MSRRMTRACKQGKHDFCKGMGGKIAEKRNGIWGVGRACGCDCHGKGKR